MRSSLVDLTAWHKKSALDHCADSDICHRHVTTGHCMRINSWQWYRSCTQIFIHRNSHLKGQNSMWVSGYVTDLGPSPWTSREGTQGWTLLPIACLGHDSLETVKKHGFRRLGPSDPLLMCCVGGGYGNPAFPAKGRASTPVQQQRCPRRAVPGSVHVSRNNRRSCSLL